MFVLFKKRDFSSYISDTFAFFKIFGRHFFKNYFVINGGLLLVLCVLLYFMVKVYFEVLFATSGEPNGNYFLHYFDGNSALFISSLSVFVILIIVLSLLNLAFPIVYLELLSKKNNSDFTTSDIILKLKQNTKKLLKFSLGFLFVIMPLLIIILGVAFALCFVLIGFPLLLIITPACLGWVFLSLHTYLTQNTRFLQALRVGLALLKQQFWKIVGATLVILILVQITQNILTMVPYFLGVAAFFTSNSASGWDAQTSPLAGIFASLFFIFAFLLNYFLSNLIAINQGIIYYSLREENENLTTSSEIDLIGNNNE